MEHLLTLLEDLSTRQFNMKEQNGETLWSQTERNNVRNELIDAIAADIEEVFLDSPLMAKGLDIKRTCDGASINIPNDEWGCFVFSLAPKMHSLDYDIDAMADEYIQKQEAKEARVKAKVK